jgi:presenilin-like A22 family membrane protease
MPESRSNNSLKNFPNNVWKVFIIEAFLFFLTLGLGIVASFQINKVLKVEKLEIQKISFFQFILYFLFGTLLIFLFVRFFKYGKQKRAIFKTFFILTVFWGGMLLLSIWIGDVFALIFMTFLLFWWWKWPSIFIQDLCMILAMAGAGSVLGLTFTPEIIVILLIFFSVYDFIAVYKTKHMVEMAEEMIKSRAILGLVIPPDLASFKQNLKQVKPGGRFMVLGGGDVIFPLLLCSSLVSSGILNSLIVALFSLIGLFSGFLFFISQKQKKAIPALPPIALFSIIGYFLTKLL